MGDAAVVSFLTFTVRVTLWDRKDNVVLEKKTTEIKCGVMFEGRKEDFHFIIVNVIVVAHEEQEMLEDYIETINNMWI